MSIWRSSRATEAQEQALSGGTGPSEIPDRAATDLSPGTWVGEYVVVRKLGEGGFGAVYEALHPVIGKRAAVKVLHPQYSTDAAIASRFAAEARAVNQIRHKNIVDIFAFGELSDRRQFYVMELLEGVPLDEYLDRAVRLDPSVTLAILGEIAKALQAAHDAGIAHRDLKPENVILELDDDHHVHPKILDFGMAKLLAPGTIPVHKTRSGVPIGSPRYMSPEQCRGVQVDHRTDVYAFGCIAYRMLAGLPPFEAATALELMMAHVSAQPMPLSGVGPDLGPEIDECLLKMLEKLPEHRPQSILAAYDSLVQAVRTRMPKAVAAQPLVAPALLCEMAEQRKQSRALPFDLTTLRKVHESSGVVTRRHRRLVLWPLLGLLAVALTTVALRPLRVALPSSDPSVAAAPQASLAARPTPTGNAPRAEASASIDAPSVAQVTLTINAQPTRAELYLDGVRVGTANQPLRVPTGNAPRTLVVKSPGYQPQTVTFIPSADQSLKVTLGRVKQRPTGGVPRDLEDPY